MNSLLDSLVSMQDLLEARCGEAAGSFLGARLTSLRLSGPTVKRLFGVLLVVMTAVQLFASCERKPVCNYETRLSTLRPSLHGECSSGAVRGASSCR